MRGRIYNAMQQKLYFTYRSYLKSRFGTPVLKIPVNAGFSCPNRDGTKSVEGCLFCDNRSFSPVSECSLSPVDQVMTAICRSGEKYKAFLPYLQPFSNTYAPAEKLRAIYEPLLKEPNVVGLAVGTRPDCFDRSIYDYLGELAGRTYLSIELGLQSGHDKTLEKINRGHSVKDFCDAVTVLHSMGIQTVAHVMLGFPWETLEMAGKTARLLSRLPVSGVKIHQLMIIRGTTLETQYQAGALEPVSIENYAVQLGLFLSLLRPDQHIHRIMADSRPEFGLVEPLWSAHKQESMDFLHRYLTQNGITQGSGLSSDSVI